MTEDRSDEAEALHMLDVDDEVGSYDMTEMALLSRACNQMSYSTQLW